jgi:hypothetical protein
MAPCRVPTRARRHKLTVGVGVVVVVVARAAGPQTQIACIQGRRQPDDRLAPHYR